MRLLGRAVHADAILGRRRMTAWLRNRGEEVNPKRVARLMERRGLRLSIRNRG